jgi:ribonuclease R
VRAAPIVGVIQKEKIATKAKNLPNPGKNQGLSNFMNHPLQPPATAVAFIRQDKRGLRAVGAFDRFDLPLADSASTGVLAHVTRTSPAKLLHTIGRASSVRAVIEALALHNEELAFTNSQERAAADLAAAGESFPRRDLRDLTVFTIDGEHTRDFDDALSARREGACIRIWVHVADVAAYVRPNTQLDIEAARRATSVYLPTLTIPMLPEALSTGVCSLAPSQDRAAVTCELLLRNGEVQTREFYRSVINSNARLTYSHVEDIFLGRTEPGPTYAAALAAARQAAVDRYAESSERSREPVFKFNGDTVCDVSLRPEEESQQLIERLMVLANQEVAHFLRERGTPTLYRTHALSDPERVQKVRSRLLSLGLEVKATDGPGVVDAVAAYEQAHGASEMLQMVLWGMRPPALYARESEAHEGLGLSTYCHFTSPIRRYSDLIVHRALLAEIGAEALTTSPRYTDLPTIAEHLNERTRASKKIERRAESICRVSLLRSRWGDTLSEQVFPGTISGMSSAGCFVRFDCAEGLLSSRDIDGTVNEQQSIWRLPDRKVRLGDEVLVKVKSVDTVRGQLRLAWG